MPSRVPVPAPFSGALAVQVAVGDAVAKGDVLGSVEAMKMEAGLFAPVAGCVAELLRAGGETVEAGEPVIVLEER